MSPFFEAMLTKHFAESSQAAVEVKGPPDIEMTHDQFLELMKVVHPPHEAIKVDTVEYLLALAHYFQIELVISRVDDFLAEGDRKHRLVSLIKKVIIVDKYTDKLVKTKNLVLLELKKPVVFRDLMGKSEFAILSAETRAELLQDLVAENTFFDELKASAYAEIYCTNCKCYNIVQKFRKNSASRCFCVDCKVKIN